MPKNSKRPTLQQIAEHLGVTKMTISRYLRNPDSVAKETQIKIAEAIELFGYIPSRASDILFKGKSHSIGVLVPSLTNQVFADVIKGIEIITEKMGYQPLLAHYGYDMQKEEARIEALLSFHIDGLILSETVHTAKSLRMLEVADIPVIEIMDTTTKGLEQVIGFNNILAAQQMVETMIARGRKNIIYFSARMDKRTKLKMQGYELAMLKHHLVPHSVMTEESSCFSLGAQQLHQALELYPDIDGIFCTNDDLAIGAIFECQRLGIPVPEQIAIAGFHGHNVGQAMNPQLATVITPRFEIGELAAKELIQRIQGQEKTNDLIDLNYRIYAGQSI